MAGAYHGFRLRLAKQSDLQSILTITLSSLETGVGGHPDELYEYNFPHRHQYSDDHEYYWMQRLQALFYVKTGIVIVAESLIEGGGSWTVVGWAMWILNSAGGRKIDVSIGSFEDDWWKMLGRAWMKVNKALTGGPLSPRRRDVNMGHYQAFFATADAIKTIYWKGKYKENIYLSACYVSPDFQRRGLGQKMVKWGIDLLEGEEGLVLGVESEGAVRGFYDICGFHSVDAMTIRQEEEEVSVTLHVLVYSA